MALLMKDLFNEVLTRQARASDKKADFLNLF
jgi:hypothetical protein